MPYEASEGDQIAGTGWTWHYCSEYGEWCSIKSPKIHLVSEWHLSQFMTTSSALTLETTRYSSTLTLPSNPGYYQVNNASAAPLPLSSSS